MKLSKETITILKNFDRINQGIYFKPGNVIRTISVAKNIMAIAEIQESFPVEFGIYDLNNFISVLTLHNDDVELDFDEKHVIIRGLDNRSTIKYRFCAKNMIAVPPENDLVLPDPEISFDLGAEDFNWIMKTSSLLSSPHVSVRSSGNTLCMVCMDTENDAAHTNSLDIGKNDSESQFSMVFRSENLAKILPGEYHVDISVKGLSHFKGKNIEYYVALETSSNYN